MLYTNKIDWARKLTSRKLWLALADFIGMLMVAFNSSGDQAAQVTAIIMSGAGVVAYIIAEGFADSAPAEYETE